MTWSTMSIEEIALGLALEPDPNHPPFELSPDTRPPQQVLEEVLLGALSRSRVAVAFSGGVDSSGLLCLAAHVARTHGLPDPIAVTCRFPEARGSDEREWQELVIAHLRLDDWITIDLYDECDLVGAAAQRGLLAHGVRWPPLLHAEEATLPHVAGAVYVMGNGGDELTFPTRAGTLQLLASGRLVRDRAAARAIADDLRPRLARLRRSDDARIPSWVRANAYDRLRPLLRRHPYDEGFRWARVLPHRTSAPWALRGNANLTGHIGELGTELLQPLTDRVIASMLGACGRWGPPDRGTAARLLYGDTTPKAVLGRRDKGEFSAAVFGPASRAFVEQWDGSGLPDDLVDAERVLEAWNDPSPIYTSFALLQHAWLMQRRGADQPSA
jgi:asparagine synthase (glutamine-hydrolysing)